MNVLKNEIFGGTGPEAPLPLREAQLWFGTAIATPLGSEGESRFSESRQVEARALLRGTDLMPGDARLDVYNKQYWYRLITCVQTDYPCTLHLMGLREFNPWAIRYLHALPPKSAYLNRLNPRFPAFLREHYYGDRKAEVLMAAEYDSAFALAFEAPVAALPDPDRLTEIPLVLAPHAFPLRLDHDFSAFRKACLADESGEAKIQLEGEGGWVLIYRLEQTLYEKAISELQYRVLSAFKEPATLDQAFERIQDDLTKEDLKTVASEVGNWFRDFTELGWLGDAEKTQRNWIEVPS